jgi:hypothetical protein
MRLLAPTAPQASCLAAEAALPVSTLRAAPRPAALRRAARAPAAPRAAAAAGDGLTSSNSSLLGPKAPGAGGATGSSLLGAPSRGGAAAPRSLDDVELESGVRFFFFVFRISQFCRLAAAASAPPPI